MEKFKKLMAKIGNAIKTAWKKVVAALNTAWSKVVSVFKSIDWNKRVGNSEKGTSDFLHPGIAYGVSAGALVLALIIALIALLPLA